VPRAHFLEDALEDSMRMLTLKIDHIHLTPHRIVPGTVNVRRFLGFCTWGFGLEFGGHFGWIFCAFQI
jgi:hypothetical protein